MISIFIDTNILIDFLSDRKPHSNYAEKIFELANEGKLNLFTSSHSFATTHYILKKHISEKELRSILLELLELITILPIDVEIIKKGLKSSIKDFEDSIQAYSASTLNEISYIVTRNIKDFKNSKILAITPDDFINNLL
jgi:predicted nucleic acid-binding protein